MPNSWNRQSYWPVREMGRHSAHFTNWAKCLPISWNGQFDRLGVTHARLGKDQVHNNVLLPSVHWKCWLGGRQCILSP